MTGKVQHRIENDQVEPRTLWGARVVLHAAVLVAVGAVWYEVSDIVGRLSNWIRRYLDDGSFCASRSYSYNHRAYRVLRPWWESEDSLARWREERAAEWQRKKDDEAARMPVGCTLRVMSSGTITVHREPGCTPEDVRELCSAVVRGELEIADVSESAGFVTGPAPDRDGPSRAAL